MPAGTKVVLVEQEVEASAVMSVTEQVLAADEERAGLLAEEKKLTSEMEEAERAENEGAESGWDDTKWLEVIERLEAVAAELEACGGWAAEANAARIIKGLGFTQHMADSPSIQLSGGWRMRVALAKALFQTSSSTSSSASHGFGGGELLLLDEPTNHLDLNASIWLEEHLSKRHKGTVLVVSHDGGFLEEVCTDLIVLDHWMLDYFPSADIEKFRRGRAGRESKRKKDYEAQQAQLKVMRKAGGGNNKSKGAVERELLAKLKVPALLAPPKEYTVKFEFDSLAEEDDAPSVAVMGAAFAYPATADQKKPLQLFSNLRFNITAASRVALVGKNGSGKSSLMRLIAGKVEPTAGEIDHHNRLVMGYYSQHFDEELPVGTGVSATKFLMELPAMKVSE
jgi:ATPase subunit of ABC transporter with duplicated ATPase domains